MDEWLFCVVPFLAEKHLFLCRIYPPTPVSPSLLTALRPSPYWSTFLSLISQPYENIIQRSFVYLSTYHGPVSSSGAPPCHCR